MALGVVALALLVPQEVFASDGDDGDDDDGKAAAAQAASAPAPARRRGRFEFRRQNSERGTEDESTKTTLRAEYNLPGTVSRLRLDLQLPDEKTGFAGDPFNPQLGDTKIRAYFRSFKVGEAAFVVDAEFTFPTADPASAGSGKYQASAAIQKVSRGPDFVLDAGNHKFFVEWNVRQTVSFGGDADRKDINTTKPELGLRDAIGAAHSLKLNFKPTFDWVQHGKSNAVLELEGAWNASRDWRFTLKGGIGLWGEGVPGYYHRRLEWVVGRAF